MYIGNVMLLILTCRWSPPLFAQILRCPAYVLFPAILGISVVGAYGASGGCSISAWWSVRAARLPHGKLKYPSAPLILGFVLGDNIGTRAPPVAHDVAGRPFDLGQRPISAIMLGLAVLILLSPLLWCFNRARVQAITEGG